MAEVIHINGVRTKAETHTFAGHRYTLQFDPRALPMQRWVWTVKFTRTYEYVGSAATIGSAAKQAQQKILQLSGGRNAVG